MQSRKLYIYIIIGILSFYFSLCFYQYYKYASLEFLPKVKTQVVVRSNSDRHEVWIAETEESRKRYKLDGEVNLEKVGEWEYRKAQDYGYGYDYLISHPINGDNNNSSITLYLSPVENCGLTFWKNAQGAMVEIILDGKSEIYDLYSDAVGGEIVTIYPFANNLLSKIYKILVLGTVFLGIYGLIYFLYIMQRKYFKNLVVYLEEINSGKQRIIGLDIVRTVAVLFVIAVHFFLGSRYYDTPMSGEKMFIATAIRWIFFNCVPLFMLLTGYLKCNKKLNIEHYKSLIPIYLTYILYSIVRIVVNMNVFNVEYSITGALKDIFTYQFSWYIDMYIMMMILIPFLNIIWHNIVGKREKKILIGSMICLTALNPLTSLFISSYGQWLYPITFYFIGAYLREYPIKINKLVGSILIGVIILAETFGVYYSSNGGIFDWTFLTGPNCGYNALPTVITSTLLFIILYDIKVDNLLFSKIIKKISMLSFDIYLFSTMYDNIIYAEFQKKIETVYEFFPYFFITVPLSFGCAFVTALIKEKLFSIVINIYNSRIKQRIIEYK